MQSLRRRRHIRTFIVLAALVWLPMSVFAQICATQALASRIGGLQHPALVAPAQMSEARVVAAHVVESTAIATHAATFWQSVDDYESGCDMKAVCAFAALSALLSSSHAVHFGQDPALSSIDGAAFSTRTLIPDTPPPRSPQ